jgi:hypothetical protein
MCVLAQHYVVRYEYEYSQCTFFVEGGSRTSSIRTTNATISQRCSIFDVFPCRILYVGRILTVVLTFTLLHMTVPKHAS